MRLLLAVAAYLVHLAVAAQSSTSVFHEPGNDTPDGVNAIAPGRHIVEPTKDTQLGRDVAWELLQKYSRKLFTGATIKLRSTRDYYQPAQAPGVWSISPARTYSIPAIESRLFKRDNSRQTMPIANAASFAATGVSRLHAAGYTGKGVKIALIDTGVDYTHPVLGGKIGPGNKILGNFDFVNDGRTDDCVGHGTFLAGLIGANPGSNPHNIVGIAYGANITSYRAASCSAMANETSSVAALQQAFEDGNDIINLSVGISRRPWAVSRIESLAERMAEKGRIIIRAVGNDGHYGPWTTSASSGIITVGNAQFSSGAHSVFSNSSWGPTGDLRMSPIISAPGTKYFSAIPNNAYTVQGGTSVASPFVAGVAALLLEARGKNEATAKEIRQLLMNTALPMSRDGLLDSAAHQGSGLIQAFDSAFSTTSMYPTELLLNDTAHYQGSHEVTIRNSGKRTVTYSLTHAPAGTLETYDPTREAVNLNRNITLSRRPALVSITPSTVTVSAGQATSFKVDVQVPVGLREDTLPVFSGFIVASGSDGSKLRSTYMGLGAALRNMQVIRMRSAPFIGDLGKGKADQNRVFTLKESDIPVLWLSLNAPTPQLQVSLSRLQDQDGKSENLGTIATEMWAGRNMEDGYYSVPLAKFDNGTTIPDGPLQVSLRALVNTGDPTKDADWESWQSPIFTVKRNS